jgi:hypothetical protein
VRFIIATRPLVTVGRLLPLVPKDSPTVDVDKDQLLLASTADTKEAMDAFHDADSQGCFAGHEQRTSPAIQKRIRRLRRHCDKTRKRSLYTVMIEPARNNAGGHWKRDLVQEALTTLKDEKFEIWKGDRADGSVASGYLPMPHQFALWMSRIFNVCKLRQKRRMHLLAQLQGDLFHVADDAFRDALREAYLKKHWS